LAVEKVNVLFVNRSFTKLTLCVQKFRFISTAGNAVEKMEQNLVVVFEETISLSKPSFFTETLRGLQSNTRRGPSTISLTSNYDEACRER
jgi:hypothetical protein